MISYTSRQLKVHEMNYPTHDLEFATMMFAFKLSRNYLYGEHVDVLTDHMSLQYVLTQRELKLCQRRLLELMKDYNMNVHYNQGKANVVADSLSTLSMGSTTHFEDDKK